MDHSRSRYSFAAPCKMESFEPVHNRVSAHQAEFLDHRHRPPKNEMEHHHESPTTDICTKDVARTTRMKCFRLSDDKAVIAYLYDRLLLLQQQAGKRIAKLWIKGICPKKQARYPYRSKQQKDGIDPDPVVPGWWPKHLCQFTEPDHVDKKSRMDLCLHLLRLRPTLQDLKKWNQDLQGPNKTLETRGWTAFLKELTPSTTLDGLGKSPESEEKVKYRQQIMNDMYDIAEKEEAFLNGERDDDLIYHEVEYTSTVSSKKLHVKKRVSEARDSESIDTGDRRQKKGKHAIASEPQKKKRGSARASKVETEETRGRRNPGPSFVNTYPDQLNERRKPRCRPLQPTGSNMRHMEAMGHLPIEYTPGLIRHWQSIDQPTSSEESSPQTASFYSSYSNRADMHDSPQFFDAPTDFPGERDFKFKAPTHQQNIYHVHNAGIPQTYFDTVPNTPVISPATFTPLSQCSTWVGEFDIAPAMARYPGPLSTSHMSRNPAHVQAPQRMLPNDMQYADGPFMEGPHYGDRRSITPSSSVQAAYEGVPCVEYGNHQYHGLPTTYRREHPVLDENGTPIPFGYSERIQDANFPAAPLPGSVVRGYTGTSSGVGDGAWT